MENRKKIGLVGYLGYATSNPIIGGQMSKTRGIIKELEHTYPNQIISVDTSNWKKEIGTLLAQCMDVARQCDVVIIMPNKNGIKFILPFFAFFKGLYKYSLAYPIVGGWLTKLLKKHRYLARAIRNVDYLLPETRQLKEELGEFTTAPMDVMPIFSTRAPLKKEDLELNPEKPYTFCTFSRVTPAKGIDDAIEAIAKVNKEKQGIICKLDIWGPIEDGYAGHYQELFDKYGDFVSYRGTLAGDEGLQKLAHYYMLLFPTYYAGEGFPTTVCESLMAGLPVIASDWRFNNELVEDSKTGYLVEVHNIEALATRVQYAIEHDDAVKDMKLKCLKASECFAPERVMLNLNGWINSNHFNK